MLRTWRNAFDWCCVWGLLAVLLIPGFGVGMAPDTKRFKRIERRMPSPAPTVSLRLGRTFNSLENWFKDRVAFRFSLMKTMSRLYRAMGVSPSPEKVTIGKDGWLFLGDQSFDALTQHRRLDWENRSDVSQSIEFFVALRNALAVKKIPFVLLIAPDKHTIYPEKLPDWAQRKIDAPSRLVLVRNGLVQQDVTVVDPTDILLQRKSDQQILYFPGGTHWNSAGGFYAFQQLADHLQRYVKIPEAVFSNEVTYFNSSGDNTLYAWLQYPHKQYTKDRQPWFDGVSRQQALTNQLGRRPTKTIPITEKIRVHPGMPPRLVVNPALDENKRVLLIRDSFSNFISPYLHSVVKEVVHIRHSELRKQSVMELVDAYHPDIVVYELGEKFLKSRFSIDEIDRNGSKPQLADGQAPLG